MIKIIPLSVLMFTLSLSSLSALENISFSNIDNALIFILECINNNDPSTLFEESIGLTCPVDFKHKKNILENLKNLNERTPILELFNNNEFPENKNTFKLGGHSPQWNHLHIDFIKKENKWYLSSIWQCR